MRVITKKKDTSGRTGVGALLCVSAIVTMVLGMAFHLAQAEGPSWWTERGVLDGTKTTNDYAPVNLGQLKWIATNAAAEMDERLIGGCGTNVQQVLTNWLPDTVNYTLVNVGQLKNLGGVFYDRLIEVGYTNSYPWPTNQPGNDFAVAVIGQVKAMFDFDLSVFHAIAEVSGNITYTGAQVGVIYVLASTNAADWSLVGTYTNLPAPGEYTLTNATSFMTNWFRAWRDSDNNGARDSSEAWGEYDTNGVWVSTNMTGVNITFVDPDSDGDGLYDYEEIALGTSVNNPDSDGDGFSDRDEVRASPSSLPLNAASIPLRCVFAVNELYELPGARTVNGTLCLNSGVTGSVPSSVATTMQYRSSNPSVVTIASTNVTDGTNVTLGLTFHSSQSSVTVEAYIGGFTYGSMTCYPVTIAWPTNVAKLSYSAHSDWQMQTPAYDGTYDTTNVYPTVTPVGAWSWVSFSNDVPAKIRMIVVTNGNDVGIALVTTDSWGESPIRALFKGETAATMISDVVRITFSWNGCPDYPWGAEWEYAIDQTVIAGLWSRLSVHVEPSEKESLIWMNVSQGQGEVCGTWYTKSNIGPYYVDAGYGNGPADRLKVDVTEVSDNMGQSDVLNIAVDPSDLYDSHDWCVLEVGETDNQLCESWFYANVRTRVTPAGTVTATIESDVFVHPYYQLMVRANVATGFTANVIVEGLDQLSGTWSNVESVLVYGIIMDPKTNITFAHKGATNVIVAAYVPHGTYSWNGDEYFQNNSERYVSIQTWGWEYGATQNINAVGIGWSPFAWVLDKQYSHTAYDAEDRNREFDGYGRVYVLGESLSVPVYTAIHDDTAESNVVDGVTVADWVDQDVYTSTGSEHLVHLTSFRPTFYMPLVTNQDLSAYDFRITQPYGMNLRMFVTNSFGTWLPFSNATVNVAGYLQHSVVPNPDDGTTNCHQWVMPGFLEGLRTGETVLNLDLTAANGVSWHLAATTTVLDVEITPEGAIVAHGCEHCYSNKLLSLAPQSLTGPNGVMWSSEPAGLILDDEIYSNTVHLVNSAPAGVYTVKVECVDLPTCFDKVVVTNVSLAPIVCRGLSPLPVVNGNASTNTLSPIPADRTNIVWTLIDDSGNAVQTNMGCSISGVADIGIVSMTSCEAHRAYVDALGGQPVLHFTAKDPELPCMVVTGVVNFGCSCDCPAASGQLSLQSVSARFSLGRGSKGDKVGSLDLFATNLVAGTFQPGVLSTFQAMDGYEELRTVSNVLRQLLSQDVFVNIETIGDREFTLKFYDAGTQGGRDGEGFYTPPEGEPKVTWRVRNPDSDRTNRLQIVEERGSLSITNEYTIDPVDGWGLTRGNGLTRERLLKTYDAGGMIVERTIEDPASNVLSRNVSRFEYDTQGRLIPVGSTNDPGGANQWVTWKYDTIGRVTNVVRSNGHSESYAYDGSGRKIEESSTWQWQTGGRRKFLYYTMVDGRDDCSTSVWKPRTVVEYLGETMVAKTWYAYFTEDGLGREIVERAENPTSTYGSTANQRTTTVYYPSDGNASSGRVMSVTSSDGRLEKYSYERGNFSYGDPLPAAYTFTSVSNGSFLCTTVEHLTTNLPDGVVNRTTCDRTIEDVYQQTVARETCVLGTNGYERIDSTATIYDGQGHVTGVHRADGTDSESVWDCCGKSSETSFDGTQTTYSYDQLRRMDMRTKVGATNVVTYYFFDALGRTIAERRTADGLSIATSNKYDTAGRIALSWNEAGLVTSNSYWEGSDTGDTVTVVSPDNITNTTWRYPDGSVYATEVNGVRKTTSRSYIDMGSVCTANYSGPGGTESSVWQKTFLDMLGRTIGTMRPGFGGLTLMTENYYNTTGQLVRSTVSGMPDTLYVYDDLGQQIQSGFDLDGNGVLDTATDRVSISDTYYEKDSTGAWWRVSVSATSGGEVNGPIVTNSIQKTRLTDLSTNVTSETIAIGLFGTQMVSRTSIDRNTTNTTTITIYADSTVPSVNVMANGLQTYSRSKTGIETWFRYDALERQIGVVDSRTGVHVTHYDTSNQVDWVEDAVSNRTIYTYSPVSGRRTSVTDPLTNTVTTLYDSFGRVSRQEGATYPVEYSYNVYDRMTEMRTWRDTNDTASVTTWYYDEATGLLTNKIYADGKGTKYTYTSDGRLQTRTWARGVTTAYAYTNSGELVSINYSDATPDVTFAYDRLGRQTNATVDGVGTYDYVFDPVTFALTNETVRILAGATGSISRSSDSLGRSSGFSLVGPDLGSAPFMEITYGFDTVGRFAAITSVVQSVTSAVSYTYLADSDLLSGHSVTIVGSAGTVTVFRVYEQNRNLLAAVSNAYNGTVVNGFDYSNDAAGRRTRRVDSSSGASQVTNMFGYNPRSELATAGMGTNSFGYAYDSLGNRTAATNNAEVLTYLANALNQYTNIADGVTDTPTYDDDGNMFACAGWTFSWDGENRLVGASNGTTVLSFAYDHQSRRIMKTYSGAGTPSSRTNFFLYDGWAMVSEIVSSSNTCTNAYVYGLDLSGTLQGAGTIGGLLFAHFGGTTSVSSAFYTFDGNGNVIDLLDTNGTTVAHYEYDPYGNVLNVSGTLSSVNPFRFSSKYTDDETGLLYYGYRYYSPGLGRWASRDPIEEQGGDNLYIFVENGPGHLVDSLGLWTRPSRATRMGLVKPYTTTSTGARVRTNLREMSRIEDIGIHAATGNRTSGGGFTIIPYVAGSYVGSGLFGIIPIEIDLVVEIVINPNIVDGIDDQPVCSVAVYKKHDRTERLDDPNAGDFGMYRGVPNKIREVVLAHEMGHAKSFWNDALPVFKSELAELIYTRVWSWNRTVVPEAITIARSRELVVASKTKADEATVAFFTNRPKWEPSDARVFRADYAWQKVRP